MPATDCGYNVMLLSGGADCVEGRTFENRNVLEIWPEASLNISARFPVTFSAINEFPFLCIGGFCPRL